MYPYAAKLSKEYLRSTLPADVRVATKVPKDWGQKLVTLTTAPARDGDNLVLSTRRLIIKCWSPDEDVAGELAETVFDAMRNAKRIPGNGIRNVTVVGTPARLDDPDDPTARFVMTVDVLLRAV